MGRFLQPGPVAFLLRAHRPLHARRVTGFFMSIAELEVSYPAHLEADVVLRTGRTLHVRPVRREDDERLRAFFKTLSPESCHARFFAMCTPDQALVHSPTHVDYVHDFGVVGEI